MPPGPPDGLVYDADFPDPSVLVVNGGYYAYSTNVGTLNVPVLHSTDLVHWTRVGDALPGQATSSGQPGLPGWAVPGQTWAPSVIAWQGRYLLYYTTHDRTSDLQCISVAVANTPAGPYVDNSSGPLVCQTALGGSIDPDAFIDGKTLYLNFKSNEPVVGGHTRLWSARLNADGLSLVPNIAAALLAADLPWEAGLIEGPAMLRADGRYLLFYSGNWFSSAYQAISYARCRGPQGPCSTRTVLPWFSAVPDYRHLGAQAGPGGPTVFQDAQGHCFLAYHAWAAPRTNYEVGGFRSLHIRPLPSRPTLGL